MLACLSLHYPAKTKPTVPGIANYKWNPQTIASVISPEPSSSVSHLASTANRDFSSQNKLEIMAHESCLFLLSNFSLACYYLHDEVQTLSPTTFRWLFSSQSRLLHPLSAPLFPPEDTPLPLKPSLPSQTLPDALHATKFKSLYATKTFRSLREQTRSNLGPSHKHSSYNYRCSGKVLFMECEH